MLVPVSSLLELNIDQLRESEVIRASSPLPLLVQEDAGEGGEVRRGQCCNTAGVRRVDEFSTVSNFAPLPPLHHSKVTLRPPLSYPQSENVTMCVRCAIGPPPKLEKKKSLFSMRPI